MNCHLCGAPLKLAYAELNCRNDNCLKSFPDRCKIHLKMDTIGFPDFNRINYFKFMIRDDPKLYIIVANNKKIMLYQSDIDLVGGKYFYENFKTLIEVDDDIHLTPFTNLQVFVPKLLKRLKNMVIFQ